MEKRGITVLMCSGRFTAEQIAIMAACIIVEKPLKNPFNLDHINDLDIFSYFRFTRDNLPRLMSSFGLPETITVENRSVFTGMEALCFIAETCIS